MIETDKAKGEEFQFAEYGIVFERSETYLTKKSFRLRTVDGPLTPIPEGAKVRLGKRSAEELFRGAKVEPLKMPTTFEVIHPFQTVGPDGEWVCASIGDVVKLEKEEALKWWRANHIKPKEEQRR